MEQEHDMSNLIEEESHNVYAKVGQDYVKVINKIAREKTDQIKAIFLKRLIVCDWKRVIH